MKNKKRVGILAGCLLVTHLLTATCTINPLNYTGRVVSGSFGSTGNNVGRTSMAMFRGVTNQFGGQTGYLDVYTNGGSISTPWQDGFDVSKITDRVVSGDFDGDGELDDIAAIYDDGNNNVSIHTWRFNSPSWVVHDNNAWTASGYDATKVTGRVVSGDFDCDQRYDDIAAFYDYGNGVVKIHVWFWDQYFGGFTYLWWWEETGYTCSAFTGRVVSGDFDRDGFCDDIATLYDYGSGAMRIHMFKGPGSSIYVADADDNFAYGGSNGWWSVSSGYTPSNITFRVVSGNFDHSGVTSHKADDLVAIYDYGSGVAKAHVWASTGSSFSYYWKWEVTGFSPSNITDRFVSFDNSSNNPDKTFGMAALYNYGTSTNVAYHWQASTGGNWNFGSSTGYLCPPRLSQDYVSASEEVMTPALNINTFPNPSDGHVTVEIAPTAEGMTSLTIVDLTGREVFSNRVNTTAGYREEIDLTAFGKGVYILRIVSPENQTEMRRLIVE